ncbi:cytochrome p450 [Moniliophthora roreri]|nr:cytochrome p450 [Moniliophthora roreri]
MLQSAVFLLALVLVGRILFQRRRATATLNKIPGPKRRSWFKGHLDQVHSPNSWDFHGMMENFGPTSAYDSWFGSRVLYTFDPKTMHHILVKEPNIWSMARGHLLINTLVFGDGLISTNGHTHKRQRKGLMPTFSANHMKEMVPIFNSIVNRLRDAISKKVQHGTQEIDMASWLSRTAFELIGQSALGVSFDSLDDDQGAHPYSKTVKDVIPFISKVFLWGHYLLPWIVNIGSPEFRHAISKRAPWATVRHGEQLSYYMWDLAIKIFNEKKQLLEKGDGAVSEQLSRGKDVLSVLMNANMQADDENRLEDREVLAQVIVPQRYLVPETLMFTATDSTSGALARTLDLLSTRQDVQERLRQEILEARMKNAGQDFSYDMINSLPYLDAVCKESLRLYPPVHRIIRTYVSEISEFARHIFYDSPFSRSNRDAVVPLGTPVRGTDGSEIREVFFPKGSDIYISLLGSNRNKDIWGPDAHEWKPERWLSPLPTSVTEARIPGVFANLMTFNGGPRSCIGFLFSVLEMKMVLSTLIESFKFDATDKEIFYDLSGVSNPQVKGELEKGRQLPINVTALKSRL